MVEKKKSIQGQLKELEEIAQWFEKETDFDIEEGLKKVKEGAVLVKELKSRIKEVENEFNELVIDKKD
jgi:exonuclease VII small subunit